MKRVMNPQDVKDQLQMFGMIVRDEDFFKKSEKIIEQFKIQKKDKVSDEEKVEKDAEG